MACGAVDQARHLTRRASLEAASRAGHSPARRHGRDRADRRRHAAGPDRRRLAAPVARGRAQGDRRYLPHLLVATRPRQSLAGRAHAACTTARGRHRVHAPRSRTRSMCAMSCSRRVSPTPATIMSWHREMATSHAASPIFPSPRSDCDAAKEIALISINRAEHLRSPRLDEGHNPDRNETPIRE